MLNLNELIKAFYTKAPADVSFIFNPDQNQFNLVEVKGNKKRAVMSLPITQAIEIGTRAGDDTGKVTLSKNFEYEFKVNENFEAVDFLSTALAKKKQVATTGGARGSGCATPIRRFFE